MKRKNTKPPPRDRVDEVTLTVRHRLTQDDLRMHAETAYQNEFVEHEPRVLAVTVRPARTKGQG